MLIGRMIPRAAIVALIMLAAIMSMLGLHSRAHAQPGPDFIIFGCYLGTVGYPASAGVFGFLMGDVAFPDSATFSSTIDQGTLQQTPDAISLVYKQEGTGGTLLWGPVVTLLANDSINWTLELGSVQHKATLGDYNTVVTFQNECPSDLIATKTNDVNGTARPGVPFHWAITVTNIGTFPAFFNEADILLQDALPAAFATSGLDWTTPDANCIITDENVLMCNALDPITILPGGSFVVTFAAETDTPGTYTNPSILHGCLADPNDAISEYNGVSGLDNNNYCSDTVVVAARPAVTPTTPPDFTVILPTKTVQTTPTPIKTDTPTTTATASATATATSTRTATPTATKTAPPTKSATQGSGTGGATPRPPVAGSGSNKDGANLWLIMLAVIGGSMAVTGAGWLAVKRR